MSVSSFTNEVGTHYLTEVRANTRVGFNYYLGQYINTKRFYNVQTGFSRKPAPVKGDKIHAFPYYREVIAVSRDEPSVILETEYFGDKKELISRAKYTSYLSEGIPTLGLRPPEAFYAELSNAYDRSLTEARNKLRDARLQNGSEIGEARETANQIAIQLSKLLYAYRSAKHGNWELVLKHLGLSRKDSLSGQTLANYWLAYIYGWKPLMSSIYDNVQALKEGLNRGNLVLSAQTTSKATFTEPYQEDRQYLRSWSCEGRVTVHYDAEINEPYVDAIDRAGVLNPLSIAWELVPFSFVLDWGIPVGAVLESLSATAGLTFAGGYVSRTENSSHNIKGRMPINANGIEYEVDNAGHCRVDYFAFTRDVLPGFAMPHLYGKKNPFSTSHVLSVLALLRQLMNER